MILTRDDKTGAAIDSDQMRHQILTLMLAGYETTASALSWTWYLLSQNPLTMDRLRREVRQVLNGRLRATPILITCPIPAMS